MKSRQEMTRYAFNRTRQAYLATRLSVAGTHWSRFRGLMCTEDSEFPAGDGLWIVPCRGVHTLAMRFPIDVLYLDARQFVVHMDYALKPWRLGRISLQAASVLELPRETLRRSGTAIGDEIEIVLSPPAEANRG
ncbi:MAG TPA: DUF192 domain-containing protein [Terriglobales bacterium]|nr:DUF192 domain-containing protein [Terriglobales bacterium]